MLNAGQSLERTVFCILHKKCVFPVNFLCARKESFNAAFAVVLTYYIPTFIMKLFLGIY